MQPTSYLSTLLLLCATLPHTFAHPSSPSSSTPQSEAPQPIHHNHQEPQQALLPLPKPQTNSKPHPPRQTRTPTRYESTLLARRLLALSSVGYLATTFPPAENLTTDPAYRFTPDSVGGLPIALPEYFADCGSSSGGNASRSDVGDEDGSAAHHHGGNGEPILIRLRISTTGKNSRDERGVSLGVDWWGQDAFQSAFHSQSKDVNVQRGLDESLAALPRMALLGHLEVLDPEEVKVQGVVRCFEDKHKDAKYWRPGDDRGAHTGEWVRMVVKEVYWVGGFGGRAWIGWLDVKGGEWNGVGRGEWEGVRLPGEEGWWKMPWFEGGGELGRGE